LAIKGIDHEYSINRVTNSRKLCRSHGRQETTKNSSVLSASINSVPTSFCLNLPSLLFAIGQDETQNITELNQ